MPMPMPRLRTEMTVEERTAEWFDHHQGVEICDACLHAYFKSRRYIDSESVQQIRNVTASFGACSHWGSGRFHRKFGICAYCGEAREKVNSLCRTSPTA